GASLERAAAGFDRLGERDAAQRSRVLAVLGLTSGGEIARAVDLLAQVRSQPMDLYTETTAWQAASWHAFALARMYDVGEPLARMVELLERTADPLPWFQCAPPTSFIGIPGTRPAMQRYVDGALARSLGELPTPLRVMADILRAGMALWTGHLDEAETLLQQADNDCRWLKNPPNLVGPLHTYAALACAVRGEREAALAHADARLAALTDGRTSGRRATWLNHCLFFKLRVAAILNDMATLRDTARELDAHPNPGENPMLVHERDTLAARLAEADRRWDDAVHHYEATMLDEPAIAPYGQAREARVRLAHAQLQQRHLSAAARTLALVFERVHSHGDLGGVLFAGRDTLAALAGADWGALLDPAQVTQLQQWARHVRAPQRPPSAESAPPMHAAASAFARGALSVPLSQREREVLSRLAAGDSNKLIARAFDLSPHTVKRHVANILDKLALQSRGQAAAWFHAQP
ncbi:MAG TPA: LuxR C-terminal-related transcriptional regulator, partial [Burkholderiaceae bacterium]|nr:LuxR C-terminal-related transcriptional regulator [Burkholderiaceae bacterium]